MKKRRLLSLLLAVVLCGAQAPMVAQAALAQPDAQAYLDVLSAYPDSASYLIDFDGDGRDELFLAWKVGELGDIGYEVWQGSSSVLKGEASYRNPLSLRSRNGNYYIHSGSNAGVMESWNYFDRFESGQWIRETQTYDGYDYSTDTPTLSITSDLTWPEGTTTQDILNAYREEVDLKEVVDLGNRTASDSALERILAASASASPKNALSRIAYIGDRSECKMDPDMARAYGDVIKNLLGAKGLEYADADSHLYVALADFAGDGWPILLTMYLYDAEPQCDSEYSTKWIGESPTFWGYKDGAAYPAEFHRLSYTNGYGTLDGKGMIYNCTFVHYVGGHTTSWCYTVSHGEIELVHTLEKYNCYIDDGKVAEPPEMPENAAYFQEQLQAAPDPVAFLAQNGWAQDGGVWYLTLDNGENVSRQFAEQGEESLFGEDFDLVGELAHINDIESHINMDTTAASTAIAALEAYADAILFPGLEECRPGEDSYDAIIAAALEGTDGEVLGVYKLSDDLYVVVLLVGETRQATLVHGGRQKGAVQWRADPPFEQFPAEEELAAIANDSATRPNVSLDLSKLPTFADSTQLLDYLEDRLDNMEGLTPNDPAKTEIGTFLESALTNQAVTTLKGKDNRVTVDAEAVDELVETARKARREAEELLQERDITLNKPIVLVLRLFWQNADLSKPCQVELTEALAEALQGCSAQLLLGDDQHYIQFSAQQLEELLKTHGPLSIQFSQSEEGGYDLWFLDGEGQTLDQLATPVTVGLPAGSVTSTVMAFYAGGSDNWGGQYDATGVLRFDTRFSGRYEVLENDRTIGDIAELSPESRSAIRFLVSKGFLTLDGESFRPEDELNRYDFTQALVGMFFALDRSLTADFPDVPSESPYYPYVASAQHDGIVNGYDDGTFSGQDPITREQVLALAARTLMERKGYTLPQDPEDYLSGFSDRADVSAWAESQVALAVREGVASRGSILLPQSNITREQAAVILYRLFLLLYEVRSVTLELPAAPAEGGSVPVVIIAAVAAGVAVCAGAGVGVWALVKKRRKR